MVLYSKILCLTFQKARLARIQIAKATSGAAFVSKKKAAEAKMAARAAHGTEDGMDTKEDIFEMQHHHLLRCLEKTTVSISYIRDIGGNNSTLKKTVAN